MAAMCPKCRSDQVSRSKSWRIPDLFMRMWGMRAYRCRECQSRFYLPTNLDTKLVAQQEWVKESENPQSARRRKKKR